MFLHSVRCPILDRSSMINCPEESTTGQSGLWDEGCNRTAFREIGAANSHGRRRLTKHQKRVHALRRETRDKRDVTRDHFLRAISRRIRRLFRLHSSRSAGSSNRNNIRGKRRFVGNVMHHRRITCDFRQRFAIAANNRTTAGLCLDDRPAESFEARWINEGDRGAVKRLEQLALRINNRDNSIGDAKLPA